MIKLDSFAKINLLLTVLPRRKDGYHGIISIFERISLKDVITIKPRNDGRINLTSSVKELACDRTNTAWKAAELLRSRFKINLGADIHIQKNVPLGSGMGGGSSNAASVLQGLNRLWKLKLSKDSLAKLGAKIGSDVPFFVYDCSFALVRGRGEKVSPLKGLKKAGLWHVIVVPKVNVSTALIYRQWDKFKSLRLTRGERSVKLISLALKKSDPTLLTRVISNSLEPVTEKLFPDVRKVKQELLASGAQSIMMSGSGPAVFGLFSSKKEADISSSRLKKGSHLWKVFVASTR